MADIYDVARWFLHKDTMTNKKLQKLCYYAEAWSEALRECPITDDAVFEAWIHGPVCPSLYQAYKNHGWMEIPQLPNDNSNKFTESQLNILESVWETYGEYTGTQLEGSTHDEAPWLNQRIGLGMFEPSQNIIQRADMRDYYRSIYSGE